MILIVPAKNLTPVTAYVSPDIHEALKRWAEDEDRTVSNLAARLLAKAVEEYMQSKQDSQQQNS